MLLTPVTLAAVLTLIPYFAAAFGTVTANRRFAIAFPAVLCIPYALVAWSTHIFSWTWLITYAVLPVAIAALLWQARRSDPHQHGNWRDFFVLIIIGLIVDLRWFERAWPAHLAVFNKILLLDAGIYAFIAIRRLDGVGFSLRLRLRDITIGLREFIIFAPIAIVLGLVLGFLHFHVVLPHPLRTLGAFALTFFFIAVPEELFFRGWLQNLLERRIGRTLSLLVTAILFGLSHFNKRAVHFNWRYVLLATIAGIFYGRAWRHQRRVGASAITHAAVDTIWGIWFR